MRGEVLRGGSVGFGLALVVTMRRFRSFLAASRRSGRLSAFVERELRIIVMLVMMRIVVLESGCVAVRFAGVGFVVRRGASQRFAREQLDGLDFGRDDGRSCAGGMFVPVAVIVVFEVFEDIAHVEKSVAVQADVHESGLHAGKDAGNFSFVDAADESEFFFALDVNFD